MLSTHGTMRPGLLGPQDLPSARDGVSPKSFMFLGATLEAELGKSLSPSRLRQTMLICSYVKIIQQPILMPSSYSNYSLQP